MLQVWHSNLRTDLVEAKLTTVGTQLPGMEDYMMAKSLQDQQKKFVMEPRCNKREDQNDLWRRARDRVEKEGVLLALSLLCKMWCVVWVGVQACGIC